jgi:serine/threonine-protein kinase
VRNRIVHLTARRVIVAVAALAAGAMTTAGNGATASRPTVKIPSVVGLTSSAAKRRLRHVGLHASVRSVVSGRPVGTVVAQRPVAHVVVGRGAVVRLSISRGPNAAAEVSVPNVIGELTDVARQHVTNAGLVSKVAYVHSLQLVGTVVAEEPAAGARVAAGKQVTLAVSNGPGP